MNKKSYKYSTYSEFLSDYAMGVPVNPKEDVAPHVLDWAHKHNFDIKRMKYELERIRLDFEEEE